MKKTKNIINDLSGDILAYYKNDLVDPRIHGFKKKKTRNSKLECNICEKLFYPSNKLERFCQRCRLDSEVFEIHHWN